MQTTKIILAAALAAPALLSSGVAGAQATGGVGVADLQAAMENTKAFQAAVAQIRSANAATITQVQTRQTALQGEIQPLVTKFEADQRANVATATLQSEANTIQARQAAAQQELGRLSEPLRRAQAYSLEQIQGKLQQAVSSAMSARSVTMLLKPDAVYVAQPTGDLTSAITAQLDTLVPSVSATPPAGWQPGQAAAAGAPGAAFPQQQQQQQRHLSHRDLRGPVHPFSLLLLLPLLHLLLLLLSRPLLRLPFLLP